MCAGKAATGAARGRKSIRILAGPPATFLHPTAGASPAVRPPCESFPVTAHDLLGLLGPARNLDAPGIIAGDVALTRRQVWERAATIAAEVELNVPPDHRVGLVDTHDAESILGILAALVAGRSVALLPVSGPDDPEVDEVAAEARCAAVLVGGAVKPVMRVAPDPHGLLDPSYGLGAGRPASPEILVLYTSGTTRRPRGVRLSSRNLVTNLTAMLRTAAPWDSSDVVGQVLPVTHSFGLSMVLLALAREAPIVLLGDGPPSRRLAAAMDEHGITIFACVPYFLRLMSRRGLDLGGACGRDLRALYLAGGGVPDADLPALLPAYRGDIYLMYGFTEATARVAVRRLGDGAAADSVGLPLPGTCVDVVSPEGSVLPAGHEGFVRASSPCLMIGYLGESPRAVGTPFLTADLGVLDVHGNLSIRGRASEVMNFRGNRVSVVAVEAAVMHLPGVLDARLTPDSRDEDALCVLHVVARADTPRDDLRRDILRAVTPKGLVREIAFVDELEKTRSGKAVRRN